MSSLSFVIRTLVLTFAIVFVMQMHWNGRTIEDHAMGLVNTAAVTTSVDHVANGAVIFIRNSWTKLNQMLNTNFSNALRRENRPGSRHESFKVKRSEKIDETYVPGKSDASAVEE